MHTCIACILLLQTYLTYTSNLESPMNPPSRPPGKVLAHMVTFMGEWEGLFSRLYIADEPRLPQHDFSAVLPQRV